MAQKSVAVKDSKVIIYTSTPNDYIRDIADKYEIPVYTKTGGSIGKDWNNALSVVDTSYATIAHQDDIYLPEYGTGIIAEFEKNNNTNIVFSDYEENDEYDKIRKRSINLKIKTIGLKVMSLFPWKSYQRRIYAFGNFICCPAVSYNLQRLTDFKFNERMRMAVDWDAWERIMKKDGKISYLPLKLMYHRIHADSETTATTIDKTREKEEQEMYERYWGKTIAGFLMRFYIHNQKSNQF